MAWRHNENLVRLWIVKIHICLARLIIPGKHVFRESKLDSNIDMSLLELVTMLVDHSSIVLWKSRKESFATLTIRVMLLIGRYWLEKMPMAIRLSPGSWRAGNVYPGQPARILSYGHCVMKMERIRVIRTIGKTKKIYLGHLPKHRSISKELAHMTMWKISWHVLTLWQVLEPSFKVYDTVRH